MRKTIFLLIWMFSIALFSTNQMNSLYSDHKSFSIGDILTVMITESSSASASAGSKTDKSFDHSVGSSQGVGPMDFIPLSSMGVKAKNSSSGDAETTRKAAIKATMTAKIISVEKNGNLVIKGTRSIKINGEEEITTIQGIVRSQDISADNTIYSYNIADAQISYKGKGSVKNGSKVGFISRIFNFLF